jgi:hypothetical protein
MATDTTTSTSGSIEERAMSALIDVIKQGNSPEIAQAEAIMLRRLALQGDVVSSRIPAPKNITEVGGYVNLLGTLKQPEMRAQMLAGALGIAGPNPPLGWVQTTPLLAWTSIANDRPDGAAQATIPLSVFLRSDFVAPLQSALTTLHNQGAQLPLLSMQRQLPQAIAGATPPDDTLPYLARTIAIVPSSALNDPDTDAIALARLGTDPYQIVARVLSPGSVAVTPAAWDAVKCTATTCTNSPAPGAGRSYVPIAPVLAAVGFYPQSPLPQPSKATDTGWSQFRNTTGLVTGSTLLGDELSLLYNAAEIASSVFAGRLYFVWNGTTFVAP